VRVFCRDPLWSTDSDERSSGEPPVGRAACVGRALEELDRSLAAGGRQRDRDWRSRDGLPAADLVRDHPKGGLAPGDVAGLALHDGLQVVDRLGQLCVVHRQRTDDGGTGDQRRPAAEDQGSR